MLRFFVIRHGETDWNRQRKLQGHADIDLNDQGRHQAQVLAPMLVPLGITRAVTSDLKRARHTGAIALPHLRFETTPLLREIFLGDAEGLTREEITVRWGPELLDDWGSPAFAKYDVSFPGGESRRQGIERVIQFLRDQAPLFSASDRVALFSHGLLLRSFAQWASHLEESRFTTPNCCVYEFSWQPSALTFDSPPALRPQLRQIYLLPEESLTLL